MNKEGWIYDERKAFEGYIASQSPSGEYCILILQRNNRDDYSTTWVQAAWEGWMARACLKK